ncbi:VanZ family protein [Paenibacillus urinalis]|uniref:VanZ family protein n=1 Tax=Paenibacillus urinalis TaxID=521520 RepID=UPI00195F2FC9
MFQSYLFPISYAFMTFPIAALFFTLPFLIVQYRKHGYINKVRAIMLYLLLLYLMTAYFLVLLPLPAARHNEPLSGIPYQLIPFNFIHDILKETNVSAQDVSTYWKLLTERAFLQVVFNIVLNVPFGLFLRYYFRTRWVRGILLCFLLSLSFEITQLTGIFGFYDHPYRVFDVDDLIMNTLGGMIGFLLAEWFTGLLPRIEHLDKEVDIAGKRVSYTRRAVALLFDGFICLILFNIASILDVPAAFWIVTGLYFMVFPFLNKGRTFGKWLVRIHLTGEAGRLKLTGLTIRYGLLYWIFFGLNLMIVTASLPSYGSTLFAFVIFVMDGWFALHVLRRFFSKKTLLFYEQLSGTKHQITWQRPTPELAQKPAE